MSDQQIHETVAKQKAPGSGRFDYVAYDLHAQHKQAVFKGAFAALAHSVETELAPGRAQALVLTKLEEAYMWVGKAIHDEQVKRNSGAPLQEGRGNE